MPCEHSMFILSLWLDLLIEESKAGASGIPEKNSLAVREQWLAGRWSSMVELLEGGEVRELAGHEGS